MIDLSSFEPVEDKPGYYWLNKRRCEIIEKETLERAIEQFNIHIDLAKEPDQTAYFNVCIPIETVPSKCKNCPNHPINGGTGIYFCTVGSSVIY